MGDRVTYKKDWKLTQEALDRFLLCLNADRAAVGVEYLKLYDRLYYYFEQKRVADPNRLIDITIDRTARRLMSGEEIRNPAAYASGVARNVLFEHWDSPEMRVDELNADLPDGRSYTVVAQQDEEEKLDLERRLDCLEHCTERLSETERQNVIDYYGEEKRAKIDQRKQIAEHLGISQNALRVRMHRLREQLEACITKCMGN